MFKFSSNALNPQIVNLNSKRFVNKRIAQASLLKFERKLEEISKKVTAFNKIESIPKPRILKTNISNVIETIEGKDLIRKKKKILNDSYLESISEIIMLHKNYEKLPRLNINHVEVNNELVHVRVYWNFTEDDSSKIEKYNELLNEMIPDIQKDLTSNYYRNRSPEISFIYDVYDGINNEMEFLFNKVGHETSKLAKTPFDPSKLFKKEKLIKKEFDIKSVVVRDPSVDYPRDEQFPTEFKHPYEMNLFMYNLDFKKIYETILMEIAKGKNKRTLGRSKSDQTESNPSIYVSPPYFKQSDLEKEEYNLPLTEDRIKLMKFFTLANKKKIQRESRDKKQKIFDKLDDELDQKLSIKKNMEDRYNDAD